MKKEYFGTYEDFIAGYKLTVPDNFNFSFDFLDNIAEQEPERPAMLHISDQGEANTYSFSWFSKKSAQLAHALKKLGIKKGHRVMLILYRRVEFWVACLALQRLGAVVIPAPSQLTPKDIVFRVNYGQISGLIVEDSLVDRVETAKNLDNSMESLNLLVQVGDSTLKANWLSFEQIVSQESEKFGRLQKEDENTGGFDPLLIFFSSGTTGMPKMVEHNHNYPLSHYVTAAYWHDLNKNDLHLTLADTGWGKTMWGKFYGQWLVGAVICVWDFRGKFEAKALLEILEKYKITTFCAPPTVYRFLLNSDLANYDLSSLRHCTTAGELLNASVFDNWKVATGITLYEGFGQTETSLSIATLKNMKAKAGSIGKAMPGWDIVLLDGDDNEVPAGEEGEICVRLGKEPILGFFLGYVGDRELNVKTVKNGIYHTGDKAWKDEDDYFWFIGRVDDLIKSSGYRIGPFEVESALVSHSAVLEAAVTGVPDPVRGQAVKASIVLKSGYVPDEKLSKELQEHVKNTTAPYKYPRIIQYVSELPKTISGKIRRAEIRENDAIKKD